MNKNNKITHFPKSFHLTFPLFKRKFSIKNVNIWCSNFKSKKGVEFHSWRTTTTNIHVDTFAKFVAFDCVPVIDMLLCSVDMTIRTLIQAKVWTPTLTPTVVFTLINCWVLRFSGRPHLFRSALRASAGISFAGFWVKINKKDCSSLPLSPPLPIHFNFFCSVLSLRNVGRRCECNVFLGLCHWGPGRRSANQLTSERPSNWLDLDNGRRRNIAYMPSSWTNLVHSLGLLSHWSATDRVLIRRGHKTAAGTDSDLHGPPMFSHLGHLGPHNLCVTFLQHLIIAEDQSTLLYCLPIQGSISDRLNAPKYFSINFWVPHLFVWQLPLHFTVWGVPTFWTVWILTISNGY